MAIVEEYINNRWCDNEEDKAGLLSSWQRFKALGVADIGFEREFTKGNDPQFFQRLWEMNLGLHLNNCGHKISSVEHGPDFRFEVADKKVWVEAVCPTAAGLPADYLRASEKGEVRVDNMPHESILLRWTAGLVDKKRKYDRYITGNQPIVGEGDCAVIAINGCQLGYRSDFEGITLLPCIVEATFPVGPIIVSSSHSTDEVVENVHSYRKRIVNLNGSSVPTDSFLNPDYAHISAAIGCVGHIDMACGELSKIALVHNPNASNPIPHGVMGADEEYWVEEHGDSFTLHKIKWGE